MAKVELYTTTFCPFCTRAKSLLKSKGVAFDEIDVTEDAVLRQKMIELSGGRRTVPEIFIDGKIVGGYDELKALDDAGKLDQRAVADQLDDTAVVLGDRRIEQRQAMLLQRGQRAGLVAPHHTRIADHVGRKDGGKPPVGASLWHALFLMGYPAMMPVNP